MSIVVHNIGAMNAERIYTGNAGRRAKSAEKLGSGYAINRSADNAAGLSISEGMRSQIRGLDQGSRNIQDGMSLINVADGALAEVHDMLHRMTELSVQAANDTNTYEERESIQKEINQLMLEIDRVGEETEFNTIKIFGHEPFGHVETGETVLVTSPSTGKDYLSEVTKRGSLYYPSASLDFSQINKKNIKELYNKTFSFNCSQSCNEKFKFTFIDGDGSSDKAENLQGQVEHRYSIDIHGLRTGTEILSKLYNYVHDHMPNNYTAGASPAAGLLVSHSNKMYISGSKMSLESTSGYASENAAQTRIDYFKTSPLSGKIDIADITRTIPPPPDEYAVKIQAGANTAQTIDIPLSELSSAILGVDKIDVSNHQNATVSIAMAQAAVEQVSGMRSQYGAIFNRLEHANANNLNTSENLSSAESRIRDTDMASEIVAFSKESILMQVGEAMISQASNNNKGLLNLLK